jgi:hypothetical protein
MFLCFSVALLISNKRTMRLEETECYMRLICGSSDGQRAKRLFWLTYWLAKRLFWFPEPTCMHADMPTFMRAHMNACSRRYMNC